MHALRRLETQGTQFAHAQYSTLRLKLLQIGARLKLTTRRVSLSFSQAYPYAETFSKGQLHLTLPAYLGQSSSKDLPRNVTGRQRGAARFIQQQAAQTVLEQDRHILFQAFRLCNPRSRFAELPWSKT